MAAFKVTAKKTCGEGKIQKGMSVVCTSYNKPDGTKIKEAFNSQFNLGISKSLSLSALDFVIEQQ